MTCHIKYHAGVTQASCVGEVSPTPPALAIFDIRKSDCRFGEGLVEFKDAVTTEQTQKDLKVVE